VVCSAEFSANLVYYYAESTSWQLSQAVPKKPRAIKLIVTASFLIYSGTVTINLKK
jgi:hypothetical protein